MKATIRSQRRGFSLIELLIVVGIISILAAIAVPNFLRAQTRAKVTTVLNDMRTLKVGLEAYAVDNNKYPPAGHAAIIDGRISGTADPMYAHLNTVYGGCFRLTTPTRFLQGLMESPFIEEGMHDTLQRDNTSFVYGQHRPGLKGWAFKEVWEVDPVGFMHPMSLWAQCMLIDCGPDLEFAGPDPLIANLSAPYDPTNGSRSAGDIVSWTP